MNRMSGAKPRDLVRPVQKRFKITPCEQRLEQEAAAAAATALNATQAIRTCKQDHPLKA